jgi:hypothetical protein
MTQEEKLAQALEALKAVQVWTWRQHWEIREADIFHAVDAAVTALEKTP